MKTKNITIGAMCLAISLLLPQIFHLFGMQQAGAIFLPMHIPVFIGGMLLGPVYGTLVGALAPLISSLLTGMPSSERVLFMVVELASYGMFSGILFHTFKLKERHGGALITQVSAMFFGRIMYGLMLVLVTHIIRIPVGGLSVVLTTIVTGLPGIMIQLVFVPIIVRSVLKIEIMNQKTVTHKIM